MDMRPLKVKILIMIILFELLILAYLINSFISPNDRPLYPPMWGDDKVNYTQLFDGYTVKLSKVTTVHYNWDNLRDYDDITIEKPADTIRIIALGDSHTFGWGVELEESWPKHLEKMLNENPVNEKYQVLNLGMCGWGFKNYIERLKKKGLKYEPDIVIIGYHHDDVGSAALSEEFMVEYRERHPNLGYLEAEMKAGVKYYEEIFSNIGHYWEIGVVNYTEELRDLSKAYNFSVVFVFGIDITSKNEGATEFERAYYQRLINLIDQYNFELVYVKPYIENIDKNKLILAELDQHPSSLYHKMIATAIYEHMSKDVA